MKKLAIFSAIIAVLVAGGCIARYLDLHRFDHLFFINRRTGVVHNYKCQHFRDGQECDYIKLEELKHPKLWDCRICGGRTIKTPKQRSRSAEGF